MWGWYHHSYLTGKEFEILKSRFFLFYLSAMIRLSGRPLKGSTLSCSSLLPPVLNVEDKVAFWRFLMEFFRTLSAPFLTTSEEWEWLIWWVYLGRIDWTCSNSPHLLFLTQTWAAAHRDKEFFSFTPHLQYYLASLCTYGGLSESKTTMRRWLSMPDLLI